MPDSPRNELHLGHGRLGNPSVEKLDMPRRCTWGRDIKEKTAEIQLLHLVAGWFGLVIGSQWSTTNSGYPAVNDIQEVTKHNFTAKPTKQMADVPSNQVSSQEGIL